MNKKLAFDIDGVICSSLNGNYSESKPNYNAINKINNLHSEGHEIIIFTARYMGRTNDNVEKAYEIGYEATKKQLINWGVKFDRLIMGKPDFDLLIDDKAYNYNENWIKNSSLIR